MTVRKRITYGVVAVLLIIAIIAFFLAPVLFASVTYPLPEKYQGSVAKWTKEYCGDMVTPNFLAALIYTESGWSEKAHSYAGAIGMTQFIPSTAVAVASRLGVSPFTPSDLTNNPDLSIRFGAYYICTRIKDYGGDIKKGLIAYNGGGGAVNAFERGTPVRGTVAYAEKIVAIEKAYDKIYGNWWSLPDFTGDFKVEPKTNISLVSTIPILDFWRGLVSSNTPISQEATPVAEQTSIESDSGLNNLWKLFIPSGN
jgi:hypothetical protein